MSKFCFPIYSHLCHSLYTPFLPPYCLKNQLSGIAWPFFPSSPNLPLHLHLRSHSSLLLIPQLHQTMPFPPMIMQFYTSSLLGSLLYPDMFPLLHRIYSFSSFKTHNKCLILIDAILNLLRKSHTFPYSHTFILRFNTCHWLSPPGKAFVPPSWYLT